MTKFAALFACVLCALLSACKQNRQKYMQMEESLSREKIEKYEKSVVWSEPLRTKGLEKKALIEPHDGFPSNLIVYRQGDDIYPRLAGFGSLDTSALPSEIFDLLDAFFATAAVPPPESRSVDSDYLKSEFDFLPFVMKHHFSSIPEISRMVYGEPVRLDDESWQIPVRFESEDSFTDINVFVTSVELSYAIEQIQFGSTIYD